MNILHIVYSCIPGQFRGGIPKVAYELACAQHALGHHVTIYATNYNSSIPVDVPLDRPLWSNGVKITYFRTFPPWLNAPSMKRQLDRQASQFDIIHSHNTLLALNWYAARASRREKRPLYYHVHGSLDPRVVKRGFLRTLRKLAYIYLIEKFNYRQATALFALTPAEATQLQHYNLRTPIHILPNGILPTEIHPAKAQQFRQKYNLEREQPLILYLGRLVAKKGIHLLIDAFAQIEEQHPQARLIIAGNREQEPAYTQELDDLVNRHSLGRKIIWTGYLDEEEKAAALSAADIFSHASKSEGMALAILEAMGAGLPTIVSKECYMMAATNAKALIEVPYDSRKLATALTDLLRSREKRRTIGQTARQYVQEHHSWEAIAHESIQIYQASL